MLMLSSYSTVDDRTLIDFLFQCNGQPDKLPCLPSRSIPGSSVRCGTRFSVWRQFHHYAVNQFGARGKVVLYVSFSRLQAARLKQQLAAILERNRHVHLNLMPSSFRRGAQRHGSPIILGLQVPRHSPPSDQSPYYASYGENCPKLACRVSAFPGQSIKSAEPGLRKTLNSRRGLFQIDWIGLECGPRGYY